MCNKKRAKMLLLLGILFLGKGVFDANLESYAVKNENISVVDCDDLSNYIFQQGGLSEINEQAKTVSLSFDCDETELKEVILDSIEKRETIVDLSSYEVSADISRKILVDVINENPELYYVEPVSLSYENDTENVQVLELRYTSNDSEVFDAALEKAYFEAIPDPQSMSDFEKILALHDWIVQHVEYDLTYSRYSAYDALVDGTAVCQGYTLAYECLLDKAGIENDYCLSLEMNHIWNYVKLNGNWYHVDTTWDDPVPNTTGRVQHRNFLLSDEGIAKAGSKGHHDWDARQVCDDTSYDSAGWSKVTSAIFKVNGSFYYIKDLENGGGFALIERKDNIETSLLQIDATWLTYHGTFYSNSYSYLNYDAGSFYFNDPSNVYEYQLGWEAPKVIYTYGGEKGWIYGLFVCDDEVKIELTEEPFEEEKQFETFAIERSLKKINLTAEPENTVCGYTTAPVITVALNVKEGVSDTPIYQWYQITEDAEGRFVKTKLEGKTVENYMLENGLDIGVYKYQVQVTLGDTVKYQTLAVRVEHAYEEEWKYDVSAHWKECVCGDKNEVANHSYEWVIDQPAGEFTTGIQHEECSVCHAKRNENTEINSKTGIRRISGATRYKTSFSIADFMKEKMGISKFETVIVASGRNGNEADALSGSYLAAVKNAPILLTNETKEQITELYAYIRENVAAGGKIYILGGESALPNTVESICAEGYDVKRLEGSTRYETSVAILNEAGITGNEIIVATGKTFADSLSASSTGRPILLVKPNQALNEAQKTVLKRIQGCRIYIAGGINAVTEKIEAELNTYGTVSRMEGNTRYETSVKIAETFFGTADQAVVASGKTAADGLCGGPVAYYMKAPLVLTKDGAAQYAKGYLADHQIQSGYVLGGSATLNDPIVKEVFSLD